MREDTLGCVCRKLSLTGVFRTVFSLCFDFTAVFLATSAFPESQLQFHEAEGRCGTCDGLLGECLTAQIILFY